MKIIKLVTQNVKRIKAVEITPEGSLVVIGGNNAQGKTSVLDSIMYALGGASTLPPKPLRQGAKKGKVVLDLGEIKVTRTITSKTNQLVVESADGEKYTSPQAILDKLTGKLTFDPLTFSRMAPKVQLETLKELVGMDFSDLDDYYKKTYEERSGVNVKIKHLAGQIQGLPDIDKSVPPEEVSVTDLMSELERRQKVNDDNASEQQALEDIGRERGLATQRCDEAKAQLKKCEAAVKICETGHERAKELNDKLVDVDVEEVRNKINSADAVNTTIRNNKLRLEKMTEWQKQKEIEAALTDALDSNRNERADRMAEADMPVGGLGFGEDGVLFNGSPWEQCSSAEQLRVSVAMGLAINPKLKVILIRDGSLLDDDSLKTVAMMAADADAQIWMERVGKGQEVSVVIEDGEVE